MPIYEYQCLSCSRKFQLLIGMVTGSDEEACPRCHSKEIKRLVSRFARLRTEEDRLDQMADRFEKLDELDDVDDPAMIESFTKEFSDSMDDEMRQDMEQLMDSEMSGDTIADEIP